jgi:uncharacterized membrane protein
MTYLVLGVLLFGGLHFASILFPQLKAGLKQRWGRGRYMGLYALLSLVGVAFLALGYMEGRAGGASGNQLYVPWVGGRHFTILLIYIGFILIFSNQSKGYIAKTLRNPFSCGIILWSLGHLMANGEIYAVVIFGLFLTISVFDIIANEMRGNRPEFEPNWKHDVRGLTVGTILFMVFAFAFHPYVLGIPVVG